MKYQAQNEESITEETAQIPDRRRPPLPRRSPPSTQPTLNHDLFKLRQLLRTGHPVSSLSEHVLQFVDECITLSEQEQNSTLSQLLDEASYLSIPRQTCPMRAPVSKNHTTIINSQQNLRHRRSAGMVLYGNQSWKSSLHTMTSEIFRELSFFADSPLSIEERLIAQTLATIALFSPYLSVRTTLLSSLRLTLWSDDRRERMQKMALEVLLHISQGTGDRTARAEIRRILKRVAEDHKHRCSALAVTILSRLPLRIAPRSKTNPQNSLYRPFNHRSCRIPIETPAHTVKKIVLVHNIREALGDEWIRNSLLLSNLLRTFSAARITVLTDRPYLYQHDRISACPFDRLGKLERELREKPADLLLLEYYRNASVSERFQRLLDAQPARLTLRTPEQVNFYHPLFASFCRNALRPVILAKSTMGLNVYDTMAAHLEMLGISAPGAWCGEALFSRTVPTSSSLALLNPFGGTREEKGFTRCENHAVVTEILRLLDRCERVAIIPNGAAWGDTSRLQRIAEMLPCFLRTRVITDLPSCAASPYETIELLRSAERIVTVEGGFAHLAMATGKPVEVILTRESGSPLTWLPRRTHPEQIVRTLATEFAERRNHAAKH